MPFEPGQVFDPTAYSVSGKPTAWRTLQKWPDGSAKIAQAQFEDVLQPGERAERKVSAVRNPFAGGFSFHPWVLRAFAGLRIASQVRDVDDVSYFATPGDWEILEYTDAVVTVRSRSYHYSGSSAGIGRDFLSQTLYLTIFRDSPIACLDFVLGNDYLGADKPSGPDPNQHALADVAINEAWLHVEGAYVAMRYAQENGVVQFYDLLPGVTSTRLLQNTYLSDAQTKRWRAILMFDDPSANSQDRITAANTLLAQAEFPIIPIADLASWQRTGAWGTCGGPVNPPGDWVSRISSEWNSWRNPQNFGPFGGWGDLLETYVGGTPRNGPASTMGTEAVQTGQVEPAIQLEGIAWQQALRPYHLWQLRVEPTTDILLFEGLPFTVGGGRPISTENLGRLALFQSDPYKHWRTGVPLGKAQGWTAYDTEHWTTDFLFDYHTLTGDQWALEELRNMGNCLMGALREYYYYTSFTILAARSEGWTMQGFVQAYLATGDQRFKDAALFRVYNLIDVKRNKNHPSRAIVFQDNQDKSPYPPPNQYYLAWQHAPVVFGFVAASRFFEDPVCLQIAHDVVPAVTYSWVFNYQDPHWGFVPNGLRYNCPVEYQGQPIPADYFDKTPGIGVIWGDSPLGGAHVMLIGAMDMIRETSTDPVIRGTALGIREVLHSPIRAQGDAWRWDKWMNLREPGN